MNDLWNIMAKPVPVVGARLVKPLGADTLFPPKLSRFETEVERRALDRRGKIMLLIRNAPSGIRCIQAQRMTQSSKRTAYADLEELEHQGLAVKQGDKWLATNSNTDAT